MNQKRRCILYDALQVDCGRVYNQAGHAVIRKWLALTNPESLDAGVLGYLKVNIAILGPGDPVPVHVIQTPQTCILYNTN